MLTEWAETRRQKPEGRRKTAGWKSEIRNQKSEETRGVCLPLLVLVSGFCLLVSFWFLPSSRRLHPFSPHQVPQRPEHGVCPLLDHRRVFDRPGAGAVGELSDELGDGPDQG